MGLGGGAWEHGTGSVPWGCVCSLNFSLSFPFPGVISPELTSL